MEKILLKCQLRQRMDHANSKQGYKNRDVNKKNNVQNFGRILDRFRRSETIFDETIIRRYGSFDEMVFGNVALSTKWH